MYKFVIPSSKQTGTTPPPPPPPFNSNNYKQKAAAGQVTSGLLMVISDWLKRWAFRVRKKVQFCSQTAEIKTENVDQYDWGVQENDQTDAVMKCIRDRTDSGMIC